MCEGIDFSINFQPQLFPILKNLCMKKCFWSFSLFRGYFVLWSSTYIKVSLKYPSLSRSLSFSIVVKVLFWRGKWAGFMAAIYYNSVITFWKALLSLPTWQSRLKSVLASELYYELQHFFQNANMYCCK